MLGLSLRANVVALRRPQSDAQEKCRGRFGGCVRMEPGKWGIVRFINESRVEYLQYTAGKKRARGKR